MLRKMRRTARGQSTAEYAIVIALVLGAAIAMQTYVRRTIQDRVADGADQLPQINLNNAGIPYNATAVGRLSQQEPLYASSITNSNTNIAGNANLTGSTGNASNVSYVASTVSNRNGNQVEAGAN